MPPKSSPASTAYIVDWLEKRRAEGRSFQSIADELRTKSGRQITKQQLSSLCTTPPRVNAGARTELVFTNALFGGSLARFDEAVGEHWFGNVEAQRRFAPLNDGVFVVKYDAETQRTIDHALDIEKLRREAIDDVVSRLPRGRLPFSQAKLLDLFRAQHELILLDEMTSKSIASEEDTNVSSSSSE